MIAWLIRRSLETFERENDYDATYLRDVLDASPEALVRFATVGAIANFRRDVPPDVYHAAKITAALRADCGPCVQLVVGFAERDGVDPDVLRGLVRAELDGLPEPVRLAARFADAVLSRAVEIDETRDRLEARFGARGVISLSFAVMSAQLYPTLKYALGHGKSCVAVTVDGERVHRFEERVAKDHGEGRPIGLES